MRTTRRLLGYATLQYLWLFIVTCIADWLFKRLGIVIKNDGLERFKSPLMLQYQGINLQEDFQHRTLTEFSSSCTKGLNK